MAQKPGLETERGVSPAIAVLLMAAVAIILAASIGAFVLGFGEETREPAPNVAETTGEFNLTESNRSDRESQVVRITHTAGENIAVEEIEIIVQASGSGVDTKARLVNLPATDRFLTDNINGNTNLIDSDSSRTPTQIIIDDDSNVWKAGDTIQFRIATSEADFRPGESPDADELEVSIVHTPSNAIIFEDTFTPSGG